MSTAQQAFPVDLADPAFLTSTREADYTRLREAGAALPLDPDGTMWLVSHHADVKAIVRLPEGRVQPLGRVSPSWLADGPTSRRLRANLAQTDDPVHGRLRGVVGPVFIPRRIEQFREWATASVRAALDAALAQEGPVDAVQMLAVDIPRGAICRFLGLPEQDWGKLTERQHDFLMIFSPAPLEESQTRTLDDITAFYLEYFEDFLAGRPAEEHSPYVQLLLQAEQAGTLSRDEVLSLVHTVLDAGYETTRTSISNIVQALAERPEVLEQLRSDPALVPSAIDELLRYRTPLHLISRFLVEDYTASDGTVIPTGAQAMVLLAAANHDPAVFTDPETIDLQRANATEHVAFGGGLHHCLGAPLARIQIQETLKGLIERVDHITPAGDATRAPSLVFPALTSLPVRLHPVREHTS